MALFNPVSVVGSASLPVSAQLTVTNVAASLATLAGADTDGVVEIILQNDPASAQPVYVGNATAQYYYLAAGASLTIPLRKLSSCYVKTAAAVATLNLLARGG